jgi:hypothetical protein
MRKGGGYLFMSRFSSLYDAIHGWMTEWMEKTSRKTTMTSFTICNWDDSNRTDEVAFGPTFTDGLDNKC